ncbi:MAG TPA: hypothetical protein DIS79_09965 [Bacteroidetes bacterium]|nr:hypothetical protein [Bacteroidota bacterium]HRK05749.1 Ig-like domain-containing protein [Chlorobiota bacterium]
MSCPLRPLPYLLLLGLIIQGCAVRGDLSGGPKDDVAAVVTTTEPVTGSTNVRSERVTFFFDDYVDRSVRTAITVLPTRRFRADWAGDEVTVTFTESLDTALTYVVTLGTSYTDVRGNKPAEAVSVVFSTGASIDTGYIDGVVEGASLENCVVLLWNRADTMTDSFSPRLTPAPWRLPIGTSGAFRIDGLADGVYRLAAVRDANANAMLDGNEDYAAGPETISVVNGKAEQFRLRLGPPLDETQPELVRARPLTSYRFDVTFSEPVVYPTATVPKTKLVDSIGTELTILAMGQKGRERTTMTFLTADSMSARPYSFTLLDTDVTDTLGQALHDTARTVSFRGVERADTTTARLLDVIVSDTSKFFANDSIRVVFSDAIVPATPRVRFVDGADTSSASIEWTSMTSFTAVPTPNLLPRKQYDAFVDIRGLRSVRGAAIPDTTVKLTLNVFIPREPGGVEGTFIDSIGLGQHAVLRAIGKSGRVLAAQRVQHEGAFVFDSLPAEEITFDVVHDVNNNGRYDHGRYSPWIPAEVIYSTGTVVTVKARWTTEGVKIVVKK